MAVTHPVNSPSSYVLARSLGRRLALAAGLALLVGALGCTYARIYSTSGNTIALTTVRQGAGESVTFTKRIVFDYTGALDVQELAREKIGSGSTLQNVSIKLKSTVADFFINLITLGLAASKTFEVTGDLVRQP